MTRLKEFWSAYSRQVVRFFTNQLVMAFLGICVGLATIAFGNTVLAVIGCVFSVGFMCILQYDSMLQLGEKDHYRPADATRPAKTLGLKISLLGSCPLFLVILTGMLLCVFASDETEAICKLIYYALNGSYLQLHSFLPNRDLIGWSVFLLATLPAIFSASLGYFLGAIDRPLRTFFGIRYTGDGKKAGK